MAREHARIQTSIWLDDDFLDLPRNEQHLYLVLVTQMNLSFCGVATWHPGRISQLAKGWTVDEVREAAQGLMRRLYIVVDEVTEEVLVRSFIRNDGLLTSPNMSMAMYRKFSEIGSRTLRGVVVHELKRLHAEQPLLKGWEKCRDLLDKASINPSELEIGTLPETLPQPESNPSGNPSHAPYSLLPTPYSVTPDSPQKRGYPTEFETVWALYPLKRDKKAAFKAWGKAIQETSLESMTEGIVRYRDDPNREQQFTKHFSTWLNAGSWDDEPLPARQGPRTGSQARLQAGLERLAEYDQKQQELGA